jgi:hypothetical protein
MRKSAEGSENEAMAAHLHAAHSVGLWAHEPTIWGAKRDLRAMVKHHEKFHARPRPWDTDHEHEEMLARPK